MNKEQVTIHIVPTYGEELDYDPTRDGRTRSTGSKINVLKVSDGYSIVFNDEEFVEADTTITKLAASIIKICVDNLKDTLIEFQIIYHYDGAVDSYFDPEVADGIITFERIFMNAHASAIPNVQYKTTDSMMDTRRELYEELSEYEPYDEDDDEEDGDYDIDEDDIAALLNGRRIQQKKKKKKKNNDYYGRSRVWKNSKQPKRQINRHGVLIAADKDDLKKDEKILKAFLKDFIPGNAKWKKDFRDDVLERWMHMYAISKKNLKQLERDHRKARTKKSRNTDKILSLTNRLFTVPADRWYDPNK